MDDSARVENSRFAAVFLSINRLRPFPPSAGLHSYLEVAIPLSPVLGILLMLPS